LGICLYKDYDGILYQSFRKYGLPIKVVLPANQLSIAEMATGIVYPEVDGSADPKIEVPRVKWALRD